MPGSQPLFELLRVDFAAIESEHQANIGAQLGTPVDLGLRAPEDGGSDTDDDSLGVRILEKQNDKCSQNFQPKYFGANMDLLHLVASHHLQIATRTSRTARRR